MNRVVFTTRIMSTTSPRPIARTPVAQGKSILLSASEEFLVGPRNPGAAVVSCVNPRRTVVMRICLLNMYHVYTGCPDIPAAATVTML